MTDISSISSDELTQRRRQLRRQRRARFLQTSWQIISMTGLTVGVVWLVTLPDWMLHDPSQVVIEGSKSLSPDVIRSMLPITYPQSVLALQPEALARQLEAEAPIADATVTRRMFPPGVTIHIQERHPVAVVYAAPPTAVTLPQSGGLEHLFITALLDDQGTWMPYEQYAALNPSQKLPALKVIGIREPDQKQWKSLYESVSRSPIKVTTIDWREPSNLILHTDLGLVHFGALSERFPKQLQVLDQMRKLPDSLETDQIAYIDLSNPDMPMLELTAGAIKPSPKPEE
ncbi:MAG: FtsQ-type POTRA domain-containing protein [Cyanobacteria bacterium RM1_2_2]|nr:FtsQ-type POTRA domain-containing protein [Cyanobacteria bacterium RM1_2_2]